MKKTAILLVLLNVCFATTYGQTSSEPITMKKAFGGYQYYQGDKRLNMNGLVNAMKPNEQAYKEIKSAQTTYTLGMIVGFAGGFMVGWPLGAAIAGGDPNWTMAGIGAGLIVVTIPISKSFDKKARRAVETYNGGLQTSSFRDKHELKFSSTGNGFGLTFKF